MSTSELPELPESEAIAGATTVSARRIGLLSDDHYAHEDARDLPKEVLRAFAGVDLIIHLGHMGGFGIQGRGVLDRLGEVAPVLAVRDYSSTADRQMIITPADGDRVAGLTRIVEANGIRVGAVHNLARPPGAEIATPPGGFPELAGVDVEKALESKFGGPVDVVAYAGSHRAGAVSAAGKLFVNPGSPTYPKGPGRTAGVRALGTVGILDVNDGVATFETIELSLLSEGGAAAG
jgi:putative phosphoesterase